MGKRRSRSAEPSPVDFAALAHGTIYRLKGAFHVWRGSSWGGAGGVVAGLYVGREPVTGRYLFQDTDCTYGVTDTTPTTARIVKLKYVGL